MVERIEYFGIVSWRQFWRAQLKHIGWRWSILLVFPVAMTIFTAFMPHDATLGARAYLPSFVVSCIFVPLMLGMWALQWRRMYIKSPYLHEPLKGVVSADEFVAEASTGRTEMPWSRFTKIKEGKDFVLLYHSPYLFSILAREFFASDAEWQAAKAFARKPLPSN
jgi:hypothetical protein